jgi:DNA-binding response OmpR family regulator
MPVSVLVIEKDALTRETITHMLDSMKYTVIPIENANRAYNILGSIVCDVIIVSLAVDDPSGVNIAMDAKAYQRATKVIVASEHRPTGNLNNLVNAYVQKPFGLKEIDEVIRGVLAETK